MRRNSMDKIILTAIALVFMFSTAGFAYGIDDDQMVIPDLRVGKPIGLIALGLGAVTYAVPLPITLPLEWEKTASQSLVKKPHRFTFQRGLGEDLDRY